MIEKPRENHKEYFRLALLIVISKTKIKAKINKNLMLKFCRKQDLNLHDNLIRIASTRHVVRLRSVRLTNCLQPGLTFVLPVSPSTHIKR